MHGQDHRTPTVDPHTHLPGCALVERESERRHFARRSADTSASLRRPRPSTNARGERGVAKEQSRPYGRHPAHEYELPSDILNS